MGASDPADGRPLTAFVARKNQAPGPENLGEREKRGVSASTS